MGPARRKAARAMLAVKYGDRCAYCGTQTPKSDITSDHVVPLSRDGGDVEENLVQACRSCNSSKGCSTLTEWRTRRPPGAAYATS